MMTPSKSGSAVLKLNSEQIIKKSKLSDYLNNQQIEMLLNQCDVLKFSQRAPIVRQGHPVEGVYIIIEGEVDIIARILSEGNTKIDALSSGGIIGGISFIEKGPSPTSALAKTNVTALFISSAYFDFLNTISPDTKYRIIKAINTQLFRTMKRTHDQAVKYIANSEMVALSFIGRALHTVTQPITCDPSSECDSYLDILMQNPLLNDFTEEEKSELLAHSDVIKAPKNCILIHEGEKKASCYIILHGAVQSSIMQNNKLAKLSVIGPDSLFAGVACVDNKSKFTISFITCESAILFRLSNDHLAYFKQEKPILWYKLFYLISRSLVALGKSINKLDVRLHIETYNR